MREEIRKLEREKIVRETGGDGGEKREE